MKCIAEITNLLTMYFSVFVTSAVLFKGLARHFVLRHAQSLLWKPSRLGLHILFAQFYIKDSEGKLKIFKETRTRGLKIFRTPTLVLFTQLPKQWAQRLKQPEREADHSLNAVLRLMHGTTSTSSYVFMVWCLIKHLFPSPRTWATYF
jgi:hypothetical protein